MLFTVVLAISVWFAGKILTFAFTSSLRRADNSSGKILFFRGLRAQPRCKRMAENEPWGLDGFQGTNFTHRMSFPLLLRFLISIFGMELGHLVPLTSWISIFGNELRLSLPCPGWMSIWFVLLAYLQWSRPFSWFYFTIFVFGCCVFRSTNLIDKNGSWKLPFSASNFDNSCRLPRHPLCLINLQALSLFHRIFTII